MTFNIRMGELRGDEDGYWLSDIQYYIQSFTSS
jgi:hypothetical protein